MPDRNRIRRLLCQSGATAIEYALIGAGIAVAISATVFLMGDEVFELFNGLKGIIP